MSGEVPNNNATPPTPAIAPGAEKIDVRAVAAAIGAGQWNWPGAGPGAPMDPRVMALVPGFDAPFFQAGLAGYSDAAMRLIARRHGCPYCVTEALLDRTLLAGGRGFDKADLGDLHDNVPGGAADHPLAGQIMGSDSYEMAAAALKMVEQRSRGDQQYRALAYSGREALFARDAMHMRLPGGVQLGRFDPTEGLGDEKGMGEPTDHLGEDSDSCDPDDFGSCDPLDAMDGELTARDDASMLSARGASMARRAFEVIDVNLACPVKKIEKKARGGHWLTDPAGAIEILEKVREAVPKDVPCTVKLRRSFDDTPEMIANFEVIFDAAYRIGYSFATVHARTVQQKYVGPSRWTFLRELRQRHPDKVILGSGDIWEAGDIFRMIAWAGMTGVSVARGCIGNPWIFRQAREMMAGREPSPPTIAEQRAALHEHFRLSLAVTRRFKHGEEVTGRMMRKFGIRFATHHPRSEEVRRRFIAVDGLAAWEAVLAEFY
jgi:tRNA-dihydrouridine synthase